MLKKDRPCSRARRALLMSVPRRQPGRGSRQAAFLSDVSDTLLPLHSVKPAHFRRDLCPFHFPLRLREELPVAGLHSQVGFLAELRVQPVPLGELPSWTVAGCFPYFDGATIWLWNLPWSDGASSCPPQPRWYPVWSLYKGRATSLALWLGRSGRVLTVGRGCRVDFLVRRGC